MTDIATYRYRIGTFQQRVKIRTIKCTILRQKAGHFKNFKQILIRIVWGVYIVQTILQINVIRHQSRNFHQHGHALDQYSQMGETRLFTCLSRNQGEALKCRVLGKKLSTNFLARYKYGNQEKKRGIKNFHLNIRSLGKKISEVKYVIKQHSPHILGLSECELKKVNNRYDESRLKIPGYDILFPASWQASGYARVVMYVKSTFHYQQVQNLQDITVQSIWIRGGFKNSRPIHFGHVYREHTSTLGNSIRTQRENLETFLHQWETASAHTHPNDPGEVHIAGDMNLDVLDGRWLKPGYSLISLSRLVESVCKTLNFTQLVRTQTRSQFNSTTGKTDISCIDHVYTNARFRCSDVSVFSFGGSDHDIIGYTRYSKDPPQPSKTIRKRTYKKFVREEFLADLSLVDWTEVLQCVDVDHAADVLTDKFRQVLNNHAPWTVYQQRKHHVPWLTEETRKMMKERDETKAAAVNLAQEGEDATGTWNRYRKLRNTINNRRKYEEKAFKTEKINKNLDSPSNTWKVTKEFMNWGGGSGPPTQLDIHGKLVTRAADIATHMNNFFLQKVQLIRAGIRHIPNTFSMCHEVMKEKSCGLGMRHVTISKVNKLLKKLKNTKSTSIDELDNYSVKIAADIIDKPLHHVITLSILQSKFPVSWKLSKVIPLHKKHSKMDMKNFRPVAILSPLSKILEKIVYEQVYEYFTSNKIFHPNMHGFRQNRSTQTALLSMYDRWVRAASEGQVTGVILLDLSAAFDLVEPKILLEKLKIYGFENDFITWIETYLTERYQAVWIDHTLSEFLKCDIGVPQGSNLGPLFFLLYFNDLLFTLDCKVENYADDTTLSATGQSVEEISTKLTKDCTAVSDWMRCNMLKLNPDKTHILTVGTEERLRRLPQTVQVVMDNVVLKEDLTRCELLLGCQVESNLKWHAQVADLTTKLGKRLTGLENIKFILPFPIRKTVTEGIFNSILVYCLTLYGGSDRTHIRELQVLQNKAAQIVCHAPPRSNRAKLFEKLGWLSVNQLIMYHTLINVYRIRVCGEPEYLAQFLKNDSITGRIIRTNTNLGLALRSFVFRGSSQWNSLPSSIRILTKIGTFKKKLRSWILTNTPRFID